MASTKGHKAAAAAFCELNFQQVITAVVEVHHHTNGLGLVFHMHLEALQIQ